MTAFLRIRPVGVAPAVGARFGFFNAPIETRLQRLATSYVADETFSGEVRLRADVIENDSSYVLRLDVPGVTKENINITVEDKRVSVEVNAVAQTPADGEKALLIERATAAATRTFQLPTSVNSVDATATHEHGVLTLTLPKAHATQQRRITVN
jgi:HSP20 family protein